MYITENYLNLFGNNRRDRVWEIVVYTRWRRRWRKTVVAFFRRSGRRTCGKKRSRTTDGGRKRILLPGSPAAGRTLVNTYHDHTYVYTHTRAHVIPIGIIIIIIMTAYRSVRPTRTTTTTAAAAAIRRYPTGIARPRRRRLRYNMLMKKKKTFGVRLHTWRLCRLLLISRPGRGWYHTPNGPRKTAPPTFIIIIAIVVNYYYYVLQH